MRVNRIGVTSISLGDSTKSSKLEGLTEDQLNLVVEEHLAELKQSMFGASSERYKKPEKTKVPVEPKPRVKKPSERYPNISVREVIIVGMSAEQLKFES